MKVIKILVPVVALLLVMAVFILPVGPVPGVLIGGTASDVPSTWQDTSAIHEVKLKVGGGGLPRVVTIWVIQVNNGLFVLGSGESGWVKKLGSGGPVELRIEDNTYSLNATLMDSGWEPVLDAYLDKYRPDYPDIVDSIPDSRSAAGNIAVFKLGSP